MMRIVVLFLMGFIIFNLTGNDVKAQQELKIKGVYQGRALYVNNPLLDRVGKQFCVTEVYVNDELYEIETKTSAFSIDFDFLGFRLGEEYEIVLKHKEGCKPEVANPEILERLSLFKIISYELVDDYSTLKFTTKDETLKSVFTIEEFRWGSWREIGSVDGKGGPNNRNYSFEVCPFSGENKYRIYQADSYGQRVYSDELVFIVDKYPVEITSGLKRVSEEITFSSKTSYAVIDSFGVEVLNGSGYSVNVSMLEKGDYFLNFENEYVTFRKK